MNIWFLYLFHRPVFPRSYKQNFLRLRNGEGLSSPALHRLPGVSVLPTWPGWRESCLCAIYYFSNFPDECCMKNMFCHLYSKFSFGDNFVISLVHWKVILCSSFTGVLLIESSTSAMTSILILPISGDQHQQCQQRWDEEQGYPSIFHRTTDVRAKPVRAVSRVRAGYWFKAATCFPALAPGRGLIYQMSFAP